MKATEVSELALKILKLLESMPVDGYKKVAALKTAANTLENTLQGESMQQVVKASLYKVMKDDDGGKR